MTVPPARRGNACPWLQTPYVDRRHARVAHGCAPNVYATACKEKFSCPQRDLIVSCRRDWGPGAFDWRILARLLATKNKNLFGGSSLSRVVCTWCRSAGSFPRKKTRNVQVQRVDHDGWLISSLSRLTERVPAAVFLRLRSSVAASKNHRARSKNPPTPELSGAS